MFMTLHSIYSWTFYIEFCSYYGVYTAVLEYWHQIQNQILHKPVAETIYSGSRTFIFMMVDSTSLRFPALPHEISVGL